MNLIRRRYFTSLIAALVITAGLANSHAQDYIESPLAAQLIDELVQTENFDRQQLRSWLATASRQESIIRAMSRPAEKVKPWYDYRKHFISERRIALGVKFWEQHRATLERAEKEFGVDPAIIVGIIGVETNYGSNTGSYRVIDALTTLAFDYYINIEQRESRQKFFTAELKNLFLLAREQQQDPTALTGSYAGAMGWGQFMPSSYRAYAVDFDGDNFADIWSNPVDAIGSVASYFSRHGWQLGQPIAIRATKTERFSGSLDRLHRPKLSVAEWSQQGFLPLSASEPSDTEQQQRKALPLSFEMTDGQQYWLGFDNFYVISRYNPRTKYAMAVYQLSELIAERYQQSSKEG